VNIAWVRFLIATITIVAGVLLVGTLFFVPIPNANEKLIGVTVGAVMGWGGYAISYYFRSQEIGEKDQKPRD